MQASAAEANEYPLSARSFMKWSIKGNNKNKE